MSELKLAPAVPTISVIMPVFNSVQYVEESVASILQQTYKRFEFIIVDDGSFDGTSEILKRLKEEDHRIVLLQNKMNHGVAFSLNRAIIEANGALIARMDADDYAIPNRLELQKQYMDENPEISVVGGAVELYEHPDNRWIPPQNNDEIRARMLFESCLYHPTVMLRKWIFEAYKYEEDYIPAEDYALWATLAADNKIKFGNIGDVVLRYRVYPDMDRSSYKEKQRAAATRVRSLILSRLGLSATSSLMKIHERLSYREGGGAAGDRKLVEKSLDELVEACIVSGYCSAQAIRAEVASRWGDAFLNAPRWRLGECLDYVSSPLCINKGRGVWHVLKLAYGRMRASKSYKL